MKLRVLSLALCLCILPTNFAVAGVGSHYVNGVEGIQAASLPPPGVYWRSYTTYYTADQMQDKNGKKINPEFKLRVFALSQRIIWSTDTNILGGNLIIDAVIPILFTDISMKNAGQQSFSDYRWGFGDPLQDIILSWHGDWYDACIGQSVYFPIGNYDYTRQANAGKGFWTFMTTVGGTVYFDKEKTWSASALFRYQINTEQQKTNITPGNTLSFEWGVGKEIVKGFTLGAAGYCSWQVSDDWGVGASKDRNIAYAAGPEIIYSIPKIDILTSLRFLFEFENRNSPQGNVLNLTLTKRF